MDIDNFTTATLVLAGKIYKTTDEDKSTAIAFIANSLRSTGTDADLCDWIAQGEWTGNETATQIQAELNAVEAQNAIEDESRTEH